MGLSGGSVSKESDCKTWVQSVGREDPLEKGMATHASILAWEIPRNISLPGPWGGKELDTTEGLTLRSIICVSQNKSDTPTSYGST